MGARSARVPRATGGRGYAQVVTSIAGVEIDEARLAAICDQYGIAELQLFGSRVRGTARPDSDVSSTPSGPAAGWAGRSSNSPTTSPTCSAGPSTSCQPARCTRCCARRSWLKPGLCMRRDVLLLGEMIEAADQAQKLTDGITTRDLETDRQRRDALLWNLTVLGEAANQLSDDVTKRFPDIAWK